MDGHQLVGDCAILLSSFGSGRVYQRMLSMAAGLMRLARTSTRRSTSQAKPRNTEYSAGSFNLSPQLNKKSNRTDSKTRKPLLPQLIHGLDHIPKLSNHQPRVEPYSASKKDSFAFESATKRWPKILTQVIDHLVDQNNQLLDQQSDSSSSDSDSDSLKTKLAQGKAIISLISGLKYEAARDKELSPLESNPDYTEHQNLIITLYNQELSKSKAAGKSTLVYRLLAFNGMLSRSRTSVQFLDRFTKQSTPTFNESQHKTQFNELLSACLWGNATDLSLLPNMHTPRNPRSTNYQSQTRSGRLDFVLDNAGFELFTDLVLADWLISNSKATQIVFHPKLIPWFVSDVMRKDVDQLLEAMSEPSKFFAWSMTTSDQLSVDRDILTSTSSSNLSIDSEFLLVQHIAKRWKSYLESGTWKIH
ncbi:hypothetical protein Pst134EB_018099 [Puccinia striiformis f. sp. tritici]|nr:hypothetical protein Pst134EB_018099 [Puccinia striiformis f. sp. tritici]